MAGRYQKIVVPLDGSKWSERAIPTAIDIAQANDAEVILLHVFRPHAQEFIDQIALADQGEQLDSLREDLKQKLMAVRNQVRSEGVTTRVQFIEGVGVANIIKEYINSEDVDLVIMASHGRTGLLRLVLGSVAREVMEEVKVPIMVVRPGKDDA